MVEINFWVWRKYAFTEETLSYLLREACGEEALFEVRIVRAPEHERERPIQKVSVRLTGDKTALDRAVVRITTYQTHLWEGRYAGSGIYLL